MYLILKGHRTIVAAPDGRLAVNTTGNSGMAKGGSGDILSGMVVSLLGQGMEPFDACCAAVYCHAGRATWLRRSWESGACPRPTCSLACPTRSKRQNRDKESLPNQAFGGNTMKRIVILPLCLLLLCGGCGKKSSTAANIQEQYSRVATAQMEAEVTFHTPQEDRQLHAAMYLHAGGVHRHRHSAGNRQGVTATVSGEELTIAYDGAVLSAGSVGRFGPVNALPCLLQAIGQRLSAGGGPGDAGGRRLLPPDAGRHRRGHAAEMHGVAGRGDAAAPVRGVCRRRRGGGIGEVAGLFLHAERRCKLTLQGGNTDGIYTAENMGRDRP